MEAALSTEALAMQLSVAGALLVLVSAAALLALLALAPPLLSMARARGFQTGRLAEGINGV